MKKYYKAHTSLLLGMAAVLTAGVIWFGWQVAPAGEQKDPLGVIKTFKGHTDTVFTLAFTPDGKYIITGSFDKTLKMWDAGSGQEVRTFGGQNGHTQLVLCTAISPDGQILASGSVDNTLKIWDIPSTSPLKNLVGGDAVNSIALSPDGKKLATAFKDGLVKVWNPEDGKELFTLKGHTSAVKSVAFSANGAILASSDEKGMVRFWNAADGKLAGEIGAHSGPINGLVINPNNATAYTIGQDGTLRFWAVNTASPRPLPAHAQAMTTLALSADGNQILTASADKVARVSNFANGQQLRLLEGVPALLTAAAFNSNAAQVTGGTQAGHLILWNNADGKIMGQILAHEGVITGVSIRPQNDQAITSGSDGLLKIWSLPLPASKALAHPDEVLAAALKSDGAKLFTGSKDKMVRSWVLQTNQMEKQFAGHTAPVTAVAISANGQQLASGGEDATIRFWNQADGKEVAQIGGHGAKVTSLVFNPAGNQLISSSADGTVKVWQVPPPAAKSLAHPDLVTSAVLTPDGTKLITGCNDKNARVWNLSNGQQERALAGQTQPVTSVAVSANGQFVAGGGTEPAFSVWKLADGQVVKKLTTPAPVAAVAINPDGKIAAAGLANNLVQVLNVADGKEIKQLSGHTGAVSALLYTPKGDQLISASADKSIKIWNVADYMAKTTLTHTGPVSCLALSKDGANLAAASGKSIKIWKLADGKEVAAITTRGDVRSIAFSPKGDEILTGEADNAARIYGLDGRVHEFYTHGGEVKAVVFHNDGKQIISGGADKAILVRTSGLVWQQTHGNGVREVVYNTKANQIISASDDKSIKIFNAADGKEVKTIPAHDAAVLGVGVNSDGTKIVSAGADKSIKVWNPAAADNKPLATISIKGDPQSVDISPDGNRVAVAVVEEKETRIRVFETASGKELQAFDDHKGAVSALAFHSDNKTFVSAGGDKTARVSSIALVGVINAHPGGVTSVQYHSSGTQAFSAGADKTAKLWDLTKGTEIKKFGPVEEAVTFAVFNRDYTQVGTASGKSARIWNVADGKEVAKFDHPAKVTSLSFNTDKSRLVTACDDKLTRVWEVALKKEVQSFSQEDASGSVYFHNNNNNVVIASGKTATIGTLGIQKYIAASDGPLQALALTPNGSHVLTGGVDKVIKMWNVANGAAERTFTGTSAAVQSVAVSPNNVLVAIGGADKTLRVYTLADAKEVKSIPAAGEITTLRFSANSQTLIGGCGKDSVFAWDVIYTAGQMTPESFLKTVQTFTHADLTDVVIGADNATVVTAGRDKTAKVWRLASPTPKSNLPHPGNVLAVVFSADGKLFATGAADGKVRVYDTDKKAVVKEINAHPTKDNTAIYGLAFSSDGKMLASAGMDKVIKIWSIPAGTPVREIKAYKVKEEENGHKDTVFSLAFSPDDKILATGSGGLERVIKFWNMADGKLLRTLDNAQVKKSKFNKDPQSHPGWIYNMRFTKDGKNLISVGNAPPNKGYLAIWNAGDGKLLSGQEMPLGAFYGLALSPDNSIIALGAGALGRPAPEFNCAYLLKMPKLQ